ncbi:hypothetical protein A5638_16725 [Mycolicibacterium fortuitum]|nr:hypothetical protein A5638_16725 [Mycolicibacterium fortuitum]
MSTEGKRAISNTTLAANLKGTLLLIHGELDDNAHPYMTMRLADALIKADKDFDQIMIPGAEHALLGRQHYFFRRTWDYFVRHLHGASRRATGSRRCHCRTWVASRTTRVLPMKR